MAVVVAALMRIKEEEQREKREKERLKNLRLRRKFKKDAEFVRDVLRHFDMSKTETLNFEEVRSWLNFVGSAKVRSKRGNKYFEAKAWKELESEFPGFSSSMAELTPPPHQFSANMKDNKNCHSHSRFPSSRRLGHQKFGLAVDSNTEKGPETPAKLDGSMPITDIKIDDDEVVWVFMMVMEHKKEGSFRQIIEQKGPAGVRELQLLPADFEFALHSWMGYIYNKPMLEEVITILFYSRIFTDSFLIAPLLIRDISQSKFSRKIESSISPNRVVHLSKSEVHRSETSHPPSKTTARAMLCYSDNSERLPGDAPVRHKRRRPDGARQRGADAAGPQRRRGPGHGGRGLGHGRGPRPALLARHQRPGAHPRHVPLVHPQRAGGCRR